MATALIAHNGIEQITDRLRHANSNRDHIMVVAHRGSWQRGGKSVLAENSISAIDRAVGLGAEMVELDVRKTADGEYVIIHDATLDRTTNSSGKVADKTLAEVRSCRLVVEGTGEETNETVPTLREAYAAIDGRILMNVDIKIDVGALVNVMRIAREMGVDRQIVVKAPTGTTKQVDILQKVLETIGFPVQFMPVLDDFDILDMAPIETAYGAFAPDVIEILHRWKDGAPLTENGGILFCDAAKTLAREHDAHVWVNTLRDNGRATFSGGRGDPIEASPGDQDAG
ncbi:MAG: glycerophosphodiester phosphodiesterase family protein [Pseudomonadota bacterium]